MALVADDALDHRQRQEALALQALDEQDALDEGRVVPGDVAPTGRSGSGRRPARM